MLVSFVLSARRERGIVSLSAHSIAALREEGRDTEAKSLQDEFAQRYPEAAKAAE